MTRPRRATLGLLLVALLTTLLSVSAFAASEGGESEPEEVAPTTTINSGLSPAVPIDNTQAEEAPLDWTYRYMIPTALALAAIIVLLTAIKYFTDVVRRRYRIVEE